MLSFMFVSLATCAPLPSQTTCLSRRTSVHFSEMSFCTRASLFFPIMSLEVAVAIVGDEEIGCAATLAQDALDGPHVGESQ